MSPEEEIQAKALLPPLWSPAAGVDSPVDRAFTRLKEGSWLADRPPHDVYKLLLDAFRLRMRDHLAWKGSAWGSPVAPPQPLAVAAHLVRFLQTVELVRADMCLLPPWWNADHFYLCGTQMVRYGPASWAAVDRLPTEDDIAAHYGDPLMLSQLRIFARVVYGRYVPGFECDDIWSVMVLGESLVDDETSDPEIWGEGGVGGTVAGPSF